MLDDLINKIEQQTDFLKNYDFNSQNKYFSREIEILKISHFNLAKSITNKTFNPEIFSGLCQIEISKNLKPLITDRIMFIDEIYQYIENLKKEIRENISNRDFKFSIRFRCSNGVMRLAWKPFRNSWFVISFISFKESISIYDQANSRFYYEFSELDSSNTEKVFDKILFEYLMNQNIENLSEISQDFKTYVRISLKPFKEYLGLEKKLFSIEKFRPKCNYTLEIRKDKMGNVEAFLDLINPPSALREAGNQISLNTENRELKHIKVFITDYDYTNEQIYIEEGEKVENWPKKGKIYVVGDLINNRRKSEAIRFLEKYKHESAIKLVDLLFRPNSMPKISIKKLENKISEINSIKFNEYQTKAIDLALSTDDISLIHGPPGTGKTTVICEIIYKVLSEGKRVLLIAPTHVAVDNVLKNLKEVSHIFPIRLGSHKRVDPEIKKYLLRSRKREWMDVLPGLDNKLTNDENPESNHIKQIQLEFFNEIRQEDKYFFNDLIINQCNLVCGTTLGVARYLKTKSFDYKFDYLIIDESSKESLLNFLVPAIHAKKWILVGDHRQLPPYVEERELIILVKEFIKKIYKKKQKKTSTIKKTLDEQVDDYFSSLDSRILYSSSNTNGPAQLLNQKHKRKTRLNIKQRDIERVAGLIRRFHEEYHALNQSQYLEGIWKKIIEKFNYDRELIVKIEDFIKFSLGSVFHFFYERVDYSRNIRLEFQYRMPLIIANFLDKNVYNGTLKTKTSKRANIELPNYNSFKPSRKFPKYLGWFSTEDLKKNMEKKVGTGYQNEAEAEVISKIIFNLCKIDVKKYGFSEKNPFTIGVINYYAKQANLIKEKLECFPEKLLCHDGRWAYKVKNKPIRIRVSIVDRFQGQEQHIIILSLTRSNSKPGNIGFTKNLQRVNVSLSRAKCYMYIVGNFAFFNKTNEKKAPLLVKMAEFCDKNDRVVKLRTMSKIKKGNIKIDELSNENIQKKLYTNFIDIYNNIKEESIKNISNYNYRKPKKYCKLYFFRGDSHKKKYIDFRSFYQFLKLLSDNKFVMIKGRRKPPNEVVFQKVMIGRRYNIYLEFLFFYDYYKKRTEYIFNPSLYINNIRDSFKPINFDCPFCKKRFKNLNDFPNHIKLNHEVN